MVEQRTEHEETNQYFVGHELTPAKIGDLRRVLGKVFTPLGVEPYYPDRHYEQQPILLKICQKIFLTRFGIFDLSTPNPNVYIELGIALGFNKPVLVLCHQQQSITLPPILQTSTLLYSNYSDLAEKLSRVATSIVESSLAPHGPYFCFFCNRQCAGMQAIPEENTFLTLDNSRLLWRDLEHALVTTFGQIGLHPKSLLEPSPGMFELCDIRQKVLSVRFVVSHLGDLADARSYLALGIAIGSRMPCLLLTHEGDQIPSNLAGFDIFHYHGYVDIEKNLLEVVTRFVQSTRRARAGDAKTAFATSEPFWRMLDKWIVSITRSDSAAEVSGKHARLLYFERGVPQSIYLVPQEGLTVGRSPDCDIILEDRYVSRKHFRVYKMKDRLFVVDLSKNGTFLNGLRLNVHEPHELRVGDEILVTHDLRFLAWDDSPLPVGLRSHRRSVTSSLSSLITFLPMPSPEVSRLYSIRDLAAHIITLTIVHPDGMVRTLFETANYVKVGEFVEMIVDRLNLPQERDGKALGYQLLLLGKGPHPQALDENSTFLAEGVGHGSLLQLTSIAGM